jgi:hypothetical protein
MSYKPKFSDPPWILMTVRLPALYTRLYVMWRLGLHDVEAVSKLVEARLLHCLGGRTGRQEMWFFADELEEKAHDREWCNKVVRLLYGKPDAKGNK